MIPLYLYRDFCISLCDDEESKELVRSICTLPEDIQQKILDEFSTKTLSKQIHPVKKEDILMASHKSYRKFTRRGLTSIGLSINQSMLSTLVRIRDASNLYSLNSITIEELIEKHLHFPPSKNFIKKSIYWTILYS